MTSNVLRQIICVLVLILLLVSVGCEKGPAEDDGMVLRQALLSKPQTLDSGNMRDVYSMMVGGQIYEPLFTYHYLKRPYELIPLIAEEMPEISDDHLTYTIKIKKGVLFQDDPCFKGGKGRELTAHDFIFGLKRIANVKYINQNWSSWQDVLVGLDDFHDYTKQFEDEYSVDYSREVEGLTALDDHTIQFKMVKPYPQFVMMLTDLSTSPVAREAIEYYKGEIVTHPVGTGPYKLKKWHKGSYLTLVRNHNWRGETYPSEGGPGDAEAGLLDDAGVELPRIDAIYWTIFKQQQPAWLCFQKGLLDSKAIPKDNFNESMTSEMGLTDEMRERNIRLVKFDEPSVFWVGFNMKDPVLGNNLPLRKAISLAIDRQRFIDIFFNGRHRIAYGFVSPGQDSYDPEIYKYEFSKFDPEAAKELIEEAENIHGGPIPALTLNMPGKDTFSTQYGQFLQRYFEDVGLTLKVDYMDWPTYMEQMTKGKTQLFASGVSAGSPDALDFLGMFATKYFAPGGNKFFYSDPEFDALYAKAEVMFPSEERVELFRKLERMVLEDYPAVFLNHRTSYVLYHEWNQNVKPHVFTYSLTKYRKVDVEKRDSFKDLLKTLK